MKFKGSDFFWPSFTDLMTSLFFIMLTLYLLTYVKLENQKKVTEKQLKQIKEVQNAIKELPEKYFNYDSVYKRFSLKQNIQFAQFGSTINSNDSIYLTGVGVSIKTLIDTLKIKYKGQDIRYVLIIEGMASKDSYSDNYPLSYKRAWSVLKLWTNNGLIPDESICEVQIAGSGIGGIGRYPKNDESKNQRILIQILPKIGELK
jgi:hypothetical protein